MPGWQVPAGVVVGRDWDVVVVGCGPAGAVAATQLARSGLNVAVLERHVFPRVKVCGDAMLADASRVLARLGLLGHVQARSCHASRLLFYSPSRIEVAIKTDALVIRREILDAMLAKAAHDVGAIVTHARVASVEAAEGAATVTLTDGSTCRARVVLIATGADVRLLEPLRIAVQPRPTGVAVRCYIHSTAALEDLVVSFERHIPHGYAWIFPLGGGSYNVGCGISSFRRGHRLNLQQALEQFLRESPLARELAGGMVSRTPVAGATLRAGLDSGSVYRSPNVLAVGETISTTLPFSGEGIGKAMETGERAACVVARALSAGDLSILATYVEELEALKHLYGGYAVAQRWLSRPWLNDLIAALVRGSPYTLERLEGILNETVDPRDVFSVRGVWRMLTG